MIHVSIQNKQYINYTQTSNCIITGEAFYQNHLYKGNDLLQLISSCELEDQFLDRLKQLNGFYALIKYTGQQIFAAVDRVRSIPLFYGQKGADFFLSDSAEWVRQQAGNTKVDLLAREEFLLTGYVTGPDTLFPDVKQLQAGEALIVTDNNTEPSVSVKRYYRFIHQNTIEASEEELLSKLDEVLLNVFKRLIKLAEGRTLVIPLSGGYDSRLIVLMLKRLGYEKVITFTYGRPGNKESEISKQIANTLGYRWEFIPYNNEAWYRWFHSEECKSYYRMADGLCSLPHIQDWPAVWEMKRQGLLPNDSVFIPGHTVTLTLKGLPSVRGKKALADAIKKKHYSLWSWAERSKEIRTKLEKKIRIIANQPLNNSSNSIDLFESWECQERQSKFIVNSVRAYEFWGYRWWLPLWDTEFMKFWSATPLSYRFNKKIYRKYIEQLNYQITGIDKSPNIPNIKEPYYVMFLRKLLKKLKLLTLTRYVLANLTRIKAKTLWRLEYNRNPMAWDGAIERPFFYQNYTGIEHINSFLVLLYLEDFRHGLLISKRSCFTNSAMK